MFGWLTAKKRGQTVNVRSADAQKRRLGVLTWDGMFAERLYTEEKHTVYRVKGLTFAVSNDYHDFTPCTDAYLSVPFVPQHGEGASLSPNDCGPACSLSVMRAYGLAEDVTVDQLVRAIGASNGRPTFIAENIQLLRRYGVSCAYNNALNVARLATLAAEGKPVIALVNYAHVVPFGRRFSHYIVVTGCFVQCDSLVFVVNDPLMDAPHNVNADDMRRALSDPIQNMPYQGIVPNEPLSIYDVPVDGA